ncbi:hypothetical protein [Pseudoalteromonas sp. 10-33]|uniref:hypothetical protein n=1 Tax=Pseudoalteromonas sp. 10-33 TaxID=1761890 RepID=UPI0007322FC1|nr:hypothetical protein [Pseudoalteromonas sp. 10-33]KTF09220.1 hypothetical protein ATS76_11300 [Pseudoalteromonas sp. 10-33]
MSRRKFLLTFSCIFLMISFVFYISVVNKTERATKQQKAQIEKQIALDLTLLDLPNELYKHAGNKEAVVAYIDSLNSYLKTSNLKIDNITSGVINDNELRKAQFTSRLATSEGPVIIVFSINEHYFTPKNKMFFLFFLLISLFATVWLKVVESKKSSVNLNKSINPVASMPMPLALIIDLRNKTLSHSYDKEQSVQLANKPLCFYLALVEYCSANSEVTLNHNKNVPDELIELANKYFYRLTELGHTIRKRPNFNNSLEKTLSEIRAGLDDVLNEYPEEKEIYYPPKAYGEGSRSRLHSYGLINIAKGNIEIIGK